VLDVALADSLAVAGAGAGRSVVADAQLAAQVEDRAARVVGQRCFGMARVQGIEAEVDQRSGPARGTSAASMILTTRSMVGSSGSSVDWSMFNR